MNQSKVEVQVSIEVEKNDSNPVLENKDRSYPDNMESIEEQQADTKTQLDLENVSGTVTNMNIENQTELKLETSETKNHLKNIVSVRKIGWDPTLKTKIKDTPNGWILVSV